MNEKFNQKTWTKNYSIFNGSWHLLTPTLDHTFRRGIIVLFGEDKLKEFMTECIAVMEGTNNKGTYYIESELSALMHAVKELIITNPDKVEKNHKDTYRINDEHFEFAKQALKVDMGKLSDKELGLLFKKIMRNQIKAHSNSILTTWSLDSEGQIFSSYLIDKTKWYVKKANLDIDPSEAFSVLTTLPKNSLQLDEDLEALKIIRSMTPTDIKIMNELQDFSEMPEALSRQTKEKILAHCRRWRWVPFTYLGPAYELDYYLQVISGLVKEKTDVDNKIRDIETRPQSVKEKREELFRKLDINGNERKVYDIAADISYLKGYRKEVMYHGFYVYSFIFKEMAKRLGCSLMDMHLISYKELEGRFIDGTKIEKAMIEARKNISVMHYKDGKSRIMIGQEAKDFLAKQKFKSETVDVNVDQLKGTTACNGSATGKVKIINSPEEMGKMEQDDIMVSHTTFPALVPAMKKAAAILTEDGGITCHAAIVSREMNTPCITGIKTLTRVLKDGDIVEVDASNGIVKIRR